MTSATDIQVNLYSYYHIHIYCHIIPQIIYAHHVSGHTIGHLPIIYLIEKSVHSVRIVYISTYTDLVEGWALVLHLPIVQHLSTSPVQDKFSFLKPSHLPFVTPSYIYYIISNSPTSLLVDRRLLCDRHSLMSLYLENVSQIHS